jgi:TonB family protein
MQHAMGTSIALAAAAAAAALAFQTADSNKPPLEPSGPWTAEVSEGLCLVGRNYGPNQQQPTLGFRQAPNAEDFEIGIWLNDTSKKGAYGMAQLRLDKGEPINAEYRGGPVAIKDLRLIWIATKRPQLDALPAASVMKVTAGAFHAAFNLRNVTGALKALADCERSMLVGWGMNPAILASIQTRPRGNFVSFFSTNDYPIDAINMRKQGTTAVRFLVTTEGKVTDCRTVASSGSPLLDARTCQIITKRAKLEPAKTKDGAPVASISFARIRWLLP